MKLSSRTRYGMRAILDLAAEYGKKPMQIKMIAQHEDISSKYLEQLISMLKMAGLVHSVRGPRGGYMLTRPPADITLKEVFLTLDGPTVPAECSEHAEFRPQCPDCAMRQVWQELENSISTVLNSYTLADLMDMKKP